MQVTLLKKESAKVSLWAGGTTHEVAVYPKDALYSQRDFLYRVSFAECEGEKADFTNLPGYMRKLSLIDGEIKLYLDEGAEVKSLKPCEIFTFDGEDKISSEGKCTDFNVMMRKGKCDGSLEAFELSGSTVISLEEDESACVFLTEGEAVCFGEKAEAFEGFLIEGESDIPIEGKAKGFIAILYVPSF